MSRATGRWRRAPKEADVLGGVLDVLGPEIADVVAGSIGATWADRCPSTAPRPGSTFGDTGYRQSPAAAARAYVPNATTRRLG